MTIFAENGYVWPDDVSLFRVDSWIQVMMGQGLQPKQYHHAGKMLAPEGLKQQLAALKQQIENQVAQLPPHEQFIQKYCPAGKVG